MISPEVWKWMELAQFCCGWFDVNSVGPSDSTTWRPVGLMIGWLVGWFVVCMVVCFVGWLGAQLIIYRRVKMLVPEFFDGLLSLMAFPHEQVKYK
jgi:hypothetical protein